MDVDTYLRAHQAEWARLDALVRRARRPRSLDPAELDELVASYQRVSAQLSYARTYLDEPAIVARLSRTVGEAGAVVYGARPRQRGALRHAVEVTFPLAVWRLRRFVVVSALLLLVPAVAVGTWLAVSDDAVEASAPAAVREAYLHEDFESYYSSEPAAAFTSEVFTNNVRVAALAFAAGIVLCVPAAVLLAYNGASVGLPAGLFIHAGEGGKFFGLILPHGVLELSGVAVAGAAGLALGWAIVAPGDRSRAVALAAAGREAVVVVVGLVGVFAVAGLVEGFVTGSGLPTALRVGLGLALGVAFWAWVVGQGRRAEAALAAATDPGPTPASAPAPALPGGSLTAR